MEPCLSARCGGRSCGGAVQLRAFVRGAVHNASWRVTCASQQPNCAFQRRRRPARSRARCASGRPSRRERVAHLANSKRLLIVPYSPCASAWKPPCLPHGLHAECQTVCHTRVRRESHMCIRCACAACLAHVLVCGHVYLVVSSVHAALRCPRHVECMCVLPLPPMGC